MPTPVLIAGFVLALFLYARKATPTKEKKGHAFQSIDPANSRPCKDEDSLTIATFNIQTGKSLEKERDIHASAKVIKDVDIAGIQEVYAPSWLNKFGFGKHQTQVLAETGGFDWLLCATRRRWFREHRGNAILSKVKVDNWQIKNLPDVSKKSFRNMTIVKFTWQGVPVHLINTHLHTKAGREAQVKMVLKEFRKYPNAILMGDFNCSHNTPEIQALLKESTASDAIAQLKLDPDPQQRIDWIITRGFTLLAGRYIPKGVSDHPYYQVTLKLAEARPK